MMRDKAKRAFEPPKRAWAPCHSAVSSVILVALCAVTLVLSGGTAFALWSTSSSVGPITTQVGAIGFSVTKGNDRPVISDGGAVAFTVGQDEATAMLSSTVAADGTVAVAVPFQVTALTPMNAMFYTLGYGTIDDQSVLGVGGAVPQFFPLSSSQQCSVEEVAQTTPYVVGTAVAIGPGASAAQSVTDAWCLVFRVTPSTYTNTATAVGSDAQGTPVSSVVDEYASWNAYVFPDPGLQPDVTITVTPSLTYS